MMYSIYNVYSQYLSDTLVKENWNAQIIHITSTIIQSNLPTKITKFVAKNVFGVNEK